MPCGAIGESATISGDERKAITAVVVRAARGRVPVVAGAGGNHTAKAVFWARDAGEAGADAILSVCPDTRPSIEGLFRHFSAIADATDLPILASNVPSRSGSDLSIEAILRLAEIPNVVGLKEASVDLREDRAPRGPMPDDFAIFGGNDTDGARRPRARRPRARSPTCRTSFRPTWRPPCAPRGRGTGTRRGGGIAGRSRWIEMNAGPEPDPGPIKCALARMKRCGETARLPAVPVGEETRRRIEGVLADWKAPAKKGGGRRPRPG